MTLHDTGLSKEFKYIIFGLITYFLGVMPYLLYASLGENYGAGWLSRYQIHIPLAMPFILVYGLRWLALEFKIPKNLVLLVFAFLLANFCLKNVMNCYDFQKDWLRKLALMEATKDLLYDTYTIDDNYPDYPLLMGDGYRFYEYASALNYKDDAENKWAFKVYDRDHDGLLSYALRYPDMFNVRNYKPKEVAHLKIREGKLGFAEVYKITLTRLLGGNYQRLLSRAITTSEVK